MYVVPFFVKISKNQSKVYSDILKIQFNNLYATHRVYKLFKFEEKYNQSKNGKKKNQRYPKRII